MSGLRVLLSSAGRRVELMSCFRAAGQRLGVDVSVLATDLDPTQSPACQLADAAYSVPRADDPSFAADLLDLAISADVDVVVPTIDPELLPLAAAKGDFAHRGISLVVGDASAIAIARDKAETAAVLLGAVRTPMTVTAPIDVAVARGFTYPAIAKPRDGSSSIGFIDVLDALDACRIPVGHVLQERLTGREYTINAYVSRSGELIAAVPHQRLATRSGEVSKARTVASSSLAESARSLALAIPGLTGPFCFQAFVDDGQPPAIFEINARFGGGYPLADRAGAPFAEWVLREHLGMPLPRDPDWRAGVTMLRYDQSVFVE